MKYRLGRKQKRIILTEDGTEEIAFVKGKEEMAQRVTDILNNESSIMRELLMRKQMAFPENDQDLKWYEEGLEFRHMPKFWSIAGIGKDVL